MVSRWRLGNLTKKYRQLHRFMNEQKRPTKAERVVKSKRYSFVVVP